MNALRILLIDSYDSFTYNIVALLRLAGAQVTVRTINDISPGEIYHFPWKGIVIGPGPGHPAQLRDLLPPVLPPNQPAPVLGICLGHQYIVEAFGGQVEPMKRPLFGLQRLIFHTGKGIFQNMPNPFPAGLYHALHASRVPQPLEIWAHDEEGHCMAVGHPTLPIIGLQFHPDSILTPQGFDLMRAWVESLSSVTSEEIV